MNDNAVIKSTRFRTWSYRFAEEVLNLTKDDVDFETRCVKAKHDTRTKRFPIIYFEQLLAYTHDFPLFSF